MNIAIIGAGVSGLTTAYYLRKNPLLQDATITVYEKASKIGGNADTIWVNLPDGQGGFIPRWVDMGVNDFNLTTYKALKALWEELGIMNYNKPCPSSPYCKPLIDTESFSSPDFNYNYRYYVDSFGKVQVPDGSSAKKLILQKDIDGFKQALADWYNTHSTEGADPVTVGDWLKTQNFSDEFIYCNLYPRINGMYFTKEEPDTPGMPPPSEMPLWMVAHYYILQEAYGQKIRPEMDCHRQYFVDGSSHWLNFLHDKLVNEMNVNIYTGVPPITVSREGAQMVLTIQGGRNVFDKVIFATHADDTYNMIDGSFIGDPMVAQLTNFSFATSTIFVHQDPTFLGPLQDTNETYNIHIYDYTTEVNTYPYTISYIVNYHQNDPARGVNDPLFFITLNPYWAPSPYPILNQPDGSPAVAQLRHCKLNIASMNAQVAIDQIQLETPLERNYYFTGSFTRGAGLHVECIIHAQEIAKKIADPTYVSNQIYRFEGGKRHFAPQYILDAITRTKE